ncbi:MAG: VOC family protein [Blastocatellales bacterium]
MNRPILIFTLAILSLNIGVSSRQAVEPALFHHVHLNSTDPSTAAGFYAGIFSNTTKTEIAGITAIRSEDIHLLFDRVEKAPTVSPDSAIWHFGWGSTDMESDYQSLLEKGIAFQTPLTRLGSGLQFAYLKAPDGALVEINTSNSRAFIHVHLYSDAPLCAADWYVKNLGAASRARRTGPCEVPFAEPSEPLGVIRSPATTVRFGEISLIIYPRQRPGPLVSPRGHAVDHIAFTVRDFEGTLDRLTGSGIRIIEKPYLFGTSRTRAAMIEGPDSIAIELIEKK